MSQDAKLREIWHDRTIGEIMARLSFLENMLSSDIRKGNKNGADIKISLKNTLKAIQIEVEQFDSGDLRTNNSGGKGKIERWKNRHNDFTFVIFPEPALERVIKVKKTDPRYEFFDNEEVLLFSDKQITEMVALIGSLAVSGRMKD